jgi:transmembrane sensor
MDSQSTYDDLPWELIASALQGELSPEEDLRLRQWLDLSGSNRQKYDQVWQIWKDGMADYVLYREADAVKGWEALQQRIGPLRTGTGNTGLAAIGKRAPLIRRLAAIAAVLILAAGAGWWYISGRSAPILYETALNEQKKISLPDGSTVVISPQTSIHVARNYNKAGRTVILSAGEAHFDVAHQEQQPFMVDMDAASVKDIGTSFTVQKTKDSIKVMVSGGKVAFIKKETGESREISAGNSLCFYIAQHRFGEISATDTANSGTGSLRFDNSPLSEVIAILQKQSGKRILLNDTAIAQKRLTVHLDGESFDNDLKIICASLNLEYVEKNGVYILKNKDISTH